jgi:hypothetical protein
MQTLHKRFKATECQSMFNKLRQAIYTFTRSKCLELCEEAITAVHGVKMKNYTRSY